MYSTTAHTWQSITTVEVRYCKMLACLVFRRLPKYLPQEFFSLEKMRHSFTRQLKVRLLWLQPACTVCSLQPPLNTASDAMLESLPLGSSGWPRGYLTSCVLLWESPHCLRQWFLGKPPSSLSSAGAQPKRASVLECSNTIKSCGGVISPHLFRFALVGFPLRAKHKQETNTGFPLAWRLSAIPVHLLQEINCILNCSYNSGPRRSMAHLQVSFKKIQN